MAVLLPHRGGRRGGGGSSFPRHQSTPPLVKVGKRPRTGLPVTSIPLCLGLWPQGAPSRETHSRQPLPESSPERKLRQAAPEAAQPRLDQGRSRLCLGCQTASSSDSCGPGARCPQPGLSLSGNSASSGPGDQSRMLELRQPWGTQWSRWEGAAGTKRAPAPGLGAFSPLPAPAPSSAPSLPPAGLFYFGGGALTKPLSCPTLGPTLVCHCAQLPFPV